MSQQKESYMIFRVGGRMCAVSVANVLEVSESDDITPLPGAPEYMVGIKRFRENIIPVIDTVRRLHIPVVENNDKPNKYTVVFEIKTSNGAKRFGSLVDKVLVVKELQNSEIKMVEDIEKSTAGAVYIKGVITGEDGAFTYVLLPEQFFSNQEFANIETAMKL